MILYCGLRSRQTLPTTHLSGWKICDKLPDDRSAQRHVVFCTGVERRQLPRVGWDTDPKHRRPGLQRRHTQQLLFRTYLHTIQNSVNDRPISVPLGWVTLLLPVNSAINYGVYRHGGRWASNEVARMWQPLWPTGNIRHFVDVLRKIMKSLRHGSRSPWQNSRAGPSEYEVLTTRQQRLVL